MKNTKKVERRGSLNVSATDKMINRCPFCNINVKFKHTNLRKQSVYECKNKNCSAFEWVFIFNNKGKFVAMSDDEL